MAAEATAKWSSGITIAEPRNAVGPCSASSNAACSSAFGSYFRASLSLPVWVFRPVGGDRDTSVEWMEARRPTEQRYHSGVELPQPSEIAFRLDDPAGLPEKLPCIVVAALCGSTVERGGERRDADVGELDAFGEAGCLESTAVPPPRGRRARRGRGRAAFARAPAATGRPRGATAPPLVRSPPPRRRRPLDEQVGKPPCVTAANPSHRTDEHVVRRPQLGLRRGAMAARSSIRAPIRARVTRRTAARALVIATASARGVAHVRPLPPSRAAPRGSRSRCAYRPVRPRFEPQLLHPHDRLGERCRTVEPSEQRRPETVPATSGRSRRDARATAHVRVPRPAQASARRRSP